MSAVDFVHDGILFLLLIYGIIALVKPVSGSSLALCEGGQTCLPPKECCAQGCCYLYAPPGAPRVPMPNNDHVLSMLFLNHWYFWCFVVAIVLALLCTCSLWKKRRQLCGWDTSARHSQSEGDSAGSCYAPPQYSRCNSFHIHAPPPYTEVASKPDLYPLVFSYTDPGKGNGANYLMVQYFRNYIVQPVGSISGTSTVDSLSSSFICNANEANTLVPPPYSRAASPDLTMSFRNYLMPRSASQQVCLTAYDRSAGTLAGAGPRPQRDDESPPDQQCVLSREQQRDDGPPADSTINHSNGVALPEDPAGFHNRTTNHGDHHGDHHGAGHRTSNTPSSNSSAVHGPGSSVAQPGHRLDGAGDHCDLDTAPTGLVPRNGLVCKLCCSTGDIAAGIPGGRRTALHKSLETCCLVHLQAAGPRLTSLGTDSDDSLLHTGVVRKPSSAGSNVSSLVNVDALSSPPRATSPTAEVRELLEQIRQLHGERGDTPDPDDGAGTLPRPRPEVQATPAQPSYRRPSSLIGRRGKLFSKPASQHGGGSSKAMYIPISFTQSCMAPGPTSTRHLRSPASMSTAAGNFLNRGRNRYCWMSKSAPTTPGTAPGGFGAGTLSDNRPLLLTEQEEDGEQNV